MNWFRRVVDALEEIVEQLKDIIFVVDEILRLQGGPVVPPDEEEDDNEYGPYAWANEKYSHKEFPWPTIENPWGTQLAIWRVIDNRATVLFNVAPTGKPNFEENRGDYVYQMETVIAYRKILSGLEANGENFVPVVDPAGGAIPHRKLELVSLIDEFGFEEKVDDSSNI